MEMEQGTLMENVNQRENICCQPNRWKAVPVEEEEEEVEEEGWWKLYMKKYEKRLEMYKLKMRKKISK